VTRAEVGVAGFAGLELFRLDGRVVLITGGGRAIGTSMAGGLASDASSFGTGHSLAVDGGYVAR
jgi:hypothetical protein